MILFTLYRSHFGSSPCVLELFLQLEDMSEIRKAKGELQLASQLAQAMAELKCKKLQEWGEKPCVHGWDCHGRKSGKCP